MNISRIAKAVGLSADTVRYYEREGLLAAPRRQANGYRTYTDADVAQLRFIRTAQALGFSLAEIRAVVPNLAQGRLGQTEIEAQLNLKLRQINAHIAELQQRKKDVTATLQALRCSPDQPVTTPQLADGKTDRRRAQTPMNQSLKK